MIFSINFLNKAFILFFAGLFCLSGCARINKPVAALILTKNPDAGINTFHIAVLPVQNLSGAAAPVKDIRQSLIDNFKKQGCDIIEEEILERFMARHRVRYTGGIDGVTAQSLKEETMVGAVLITSLELYDDKYPQKIALTSRLVSTGDKPTILWMDSIGIAGDDSPGILGLGLIKDPHALQEKALQLLIRSLTCHPSGRHDRIDTRTERKEFWPKISYLSPVMASGTTYTVTVTPFLNESERKNAGEIMALHFIRALREHENFNVIEPGIVREELLGLRVIMEDGVSLANASLVLGTLNADLVISGRVLDYQDYQGAEGSPKVDFSVVIIERKSQEIIWASKSYNKGNDGVFFFDRGKINTAHTMASKMVRNVVEMMIK